MDARSPSHAPAPSTWGFLLFPGFPMACLTSAVEPLRAANEITGREQFAWTLLGETTGPVRSSAAVRFDVDAALRAAPPLDYLMLLAPPTARFADRAGDAALRRAARAGVTVGGFSGGVFPLVRSGVMAGHPASVHYAYEAAFAEAFPDQAISRGAILRARGRVTVSGAGAVFDLMLRVIEERLGRALMTEVACWFQHPFVRDEAAVQAVPVAQAGGTAAMLPPPVRAAVAIFADHIAEPVPIARVAAALRLSERSLERGFKAATGQSPLRYYRRMRLERARSRVLYSTDTIPDIARGSGFATGADLSRHYAEAFGVRPADERARLAGLRGLAGGVPPGAA